MSHQQDYDWVGPLLGVSVSGYITPFFFDPHSCILSPNAQSTSAGILITGSPGSGKTYCGNTMAMMSAVTGVQTIMLDPKNDDKNIVQLSDQLDGKISSWDVSSGDQNGVMDPFVRADLSKAERIGLVNSLVNILLGALDSDEGTGLYSAITDVSNQEDPSLSALINELARQPDRKISNLGLRLRKVRSSDPRVASVIFRNSKEKSKPRGIGQGLTIITTLGLDFPDVSTPVEHYTDANRLAIGIMFIITSYIKSIVFQEEHKNEPKTLVIDEAWMILSTTQGKILINEILRLGRSFNTVCILMTQSVNSIIDANIQSFISSQFVFRADDDKIEGKALCEMLRIAPGYSEYIPKLTTGQCFVRDYQGRVSIVQIIQQFDSWSRAFESNPNKRAKNMEEAAND